MEIAENDNNSNQQLTNLVSFYLFSDQVEIKEDANIDILYQYPSPETQEQINLAKIETGIMISLITIFSRFTNDRVSYLFTKKREFATIPLIKDDPSQHLYLTVSINSSQPNHELLLTKVLETCRSLLFLNLIPKKNQSIFESRLFRENANKVLSSIIKSIHWSDLVFDQLWPDCFISLIVKIPEYQVQAESIFSHYSNILRGLIIINRNKLILSTGIASEDPELRHLLVFCILTKMPLFYLQKVKKKEDQLFWAVGFLKNQYGVPEIFTPPIYWKEQISVITVLQLNHVRAILIIDPDGVKNMSIFQVFSRDIAPLLRRIDNAQDSSSITISRKLFGNYPGIRVSHSKVKQEMVIINNNVQTYDFFTIEKGLLNAHQFAIDANRELIIPLESGYYSYNYSDNENEKDTFIISKTKNSKDLDISRRILHYQSLVNDL